MHRGRFAGCAQEQVLQGLRGCLFEWILPQPTHPSCEPLPSQQLLLSSHIAGREVPAMRQGLSGHAVEALQVCCAALYIN